MIVGALGIFHPQKKSTLLPSSTPKTKQRLVEQRLGPDVSMPPGAGHAWGKSEARG